MTRAGFTLDDIPARLSYRALNSFVTHLGLDSALAAEVLPDESAWGTATKTNTILADIFDMLGIINANLVGIGSRKRPKQPKPYPRPKQKERQKYGHDALPIDELREWIRSKNG